MSIKRERLIELANTDTITGITKELSRFPCVTYLDDIELSDSLLAGSKKSAAVIACSDMGCWLPYVCSSANVKLFLFQNFGHQFATGGLVETILNSGIETVVVYGHSPCEYTKFVAKSEFSDLSSTSKIENQLYAAAIESDDQGAWRKIGQFKVLNELKRMLADPVIAPLAATGKLMLHGWFYNSNARQLEVFDPKQESFIATVK